MELERIKMLVQELDSAISRDGARIGFYTYGEDVDESFVQGNENGYLRLGVEFLKGGLSPRELTRAETKVDLRYLISDDSDLSFHYFEVSDEKVREDTYSWKDDLIMYSILGILISILVLAVVGLISIVMYLVT